MFEQSLKLSRGQLVVRVQVFGKNQQASTVPAVEIFMERAPVGRCLLSHTEFTHNKKWILDAICKALADYENWVVDMEDPMD